jgi:hypothetical protein
MPNLGALPRGIPIPRSGMGKRTYFQLVGVGTPGAHNNAQVISTDRGIMQTGILNPIGRSDGNAYWFLAAYASFYPFADQASGYTNGSWTVEAYVGTQATNLNDHYVVGGSVVVVGAAAQNWQFENRLYDERGDASQFDGNDGCSFFGFEF